jgi:polysaccharide export outer membrane protein
LQAFERGRLTLASALQRSGGIRQESAEGTRTLVIRRGKTKPLAYYFNMNEPETLIMATRFPLKPLDIVYVATADISKFQRVVQVFMPIIQTSIFAAAFAAGGGN